MYQPTPTAVTPKTRGCNCGTVSGKGLFDCKRYAVVRVGRCFYCKQHAELRGIVIPAPAEAA